MGLSEHEERRAESEPAHGLEAFGSEARRRKLIELTECDGGRLRAQQEASPRDGLPATRWRASAPSSVS